MDRLSQILHGLGPSMPAPVLAEALRAATGAAVGLGLTAALLWLSNPAISLLDHPSLFAPFGATAFLIFAVPNSPMAQPWAAVLGTTDPAPDRRFIPSPQVLAATLTRLRLSSNLGVEDLARLIEAAETAANARNLGPATAAQMMSRDLIQRTPGTALPELAASFRSHRFKTLPIRHTDGSFGGLDSQSALVGRADASLTARMLIDTALRSATPTTPLAAVIALLAGHIPT